MSLFTALPRALRPALLAGVLTLVFPVQGATLEAGAISDAEVKAAFLFNFAKFVQWPGPGDGALIICVVGDDPFAEIVSQTVRGRNINGREFETRPLASGDDPAGCHVMFVGVMQPQVAAELIHRVRGPVLTVGETVQFWREGGMVRFYVENNKVRFQINQKKTEAAGLKVSSQLLTLAAR